MTERSNAIGGTRVTRVGALVPLTEPGWVDAGRHLLAGLQLAAAEHGVELVVRDTAADPAKAAAAVEELAELGVAAVVGEYHSVVARTAAAKADALGLPFLCSSAVLDALTDEPTDVVARIAPPQSRGWSLYADFLEDAGHSRIAVVTQPSVYWAAGTRILRERLDVVELQPDDITDGLVESRATALLLLVGAPEPSASIVAAVRDDPRLEHVLIGAPAGQPEFADWTGIPFLRYLPDQLTPLGVRVESALRDQLGEAPSFVAFEGYDTILALLGAPWADVDVEGTRGRITFSRVPGVSVWQWAWPPIQVVDRDPANPSAFRVRYSASISGTPNTRRTPESSASSSPGSSRSSA